MKNGIHNILYNLHNNIFIKYSICFKYQYFHCNIKFNNADEEILVSFYHFCSMKYK